jgi:hypothetical protein
MMIKVKREKKSMDGTPKVTMRDNNQAARKVIREKRSRRSEWEEPLERKAATGQRGQPEIVKRER